MIKLLREIDQYADELRNDWSDFDGRANKKIVYEFTDRLANLIPNSERLKIFEILDKAKQNDGEGLKE